LRDGPIRQGEQVLIVDHLRGAQTLCDVCHPVFFDPDNTRAKGA
jgi:sarcosine oxidase subunit alpha